MTAWESQDWTPHLNYRYMLISPSNWNIITCPLSITTLPNPSTVLTSSIKWSIQLSSLAALICTCGKSFNTTASGSRAKERCSDREIVLRIMEVFSNPSFFQRTMREWNIFYVISILGSQAQLPAQVLCRTHTLSFLFESPVMILSFKLLSTQGFSVKAMKT